MHLPKAQMSWKGRNRWYISVRSRLLSACQRIGTPFCWPTTILSPMAGQHIRSVSGGKFCSLFHPVCHPKKNLRSPFPYPRYVFFVISASRFLLSGRAGGEPGKTGIRNLQSLFHDIIRTPIQGRPLRNKNKIIFFLNHSLTSARNFRLLYLYINSIKKIKKEIM
jgi:hypothetical protein